VRRGAEQPPEVGLDVSQGRETELEERVFVGELEGYGGLGDVVGEAGAGGRVGRRRSRLGCVCRGGGSREGGDACVRALGRVRGELLGEDVEDEVDGVDEIELDDGAP